MTYRVLGVKEIREWTAPVTGFPSQYEPQSGDDTKVQFVKLTTAKITNSSGQPIGGPQEMGRVGGGGVLSS